MNDSDYSTARQAADQGTGLSPHASPGAQMRYGQMMEEKHGFGRLFATAGLPSPSINPEGLAMILMVPVVAVIFVFMDLVTGWRKWRITGALLGLLVCGIAFAFSVYAGVEADLAGIASDPEKNSTVALLLDIAGGAAAAVIFFLVPRTLILFTAVIAVLSAWNYWVAPLL